MLPSYPVLVAACEGRDVEALAAAAGLPGGLLAALLEGGIVPERATQRALADALGLELAELFRLRPEVELALAGAPSRFVTEPAVLRCI